MLPRRKHIYRYEVLILAIGAIAPVFPPDCTFWLISRAVLGIGIGGGYPVSATIMSEYAGENTRGRMVGAVFANQAAGLIAGPLIASIFLASGLSDSPTGPGEGAAQLSPGVWMSTPSTDRYFCRHCSSRASCALLALSTR
jgi:MFS family permease